VNPSLSVITPSYNQAEFIERTLRSVFEQNYRQLEYIVVDGGSTDGSVDVIKRYSDELTWWVSEADRGQAHALNKGIERATGTYVAYINSDDYYLPGAFEQAVRVLESSGAAWAAGSCRYVDADDQLLDVWHPHVPPSRRHRWLIGPWGVPQAATFWRTEVFKRYGAFREDMHYVFDTEFGLRLLFQGLSPAQVDGELATRVVHSHAKSWDRTEFTREGRRLIGLFSSLLTREERLMLRGSLLLRKLGWYRALGLLGQLRRRGPLRSQAAQIGNRHGNANSWRA
jgi:glycosyltransferase involved in cell wall biosynthesis